MTACVTELTGRKGTHKLYKHVGRYFLFCMLMTERADHGRCFAGEDAPVNPCIYYVGAYDAKAQKFSLEEAKGPYR